MTVASILAGDHVDHCASNIRDTKQIPVQGGGRATHPGKARKIRWGKGKSVEAFDRPLRNMLYYLNCEAVAKMHLFNLLSQTPKCTQSRGYL